MESTTLPYVEGLRKVIHFTTCAHNISLDVGSQDVVIVQSSCLALVIGGNLLGLEVGHRRCLPGEDIVRKGFQDLLHEALGEIVRVGANLESGKNLLHLVMRWFHLIHTGHHIVHADSDQYLEAVQDDLGILSDHGSVIHVDVWECLISDAGTKRQSLENHV